jgi:predicted neutral ceramidase superfamily lipid hydrolase
MEHKINEEVVMSAIREILSEETKKVRREEYNKIQFKLDELENQLVETIKELRKVDDSLPEGLRTLSNGRLKNMSSCLIDAHNTLKQLKNKIRDHKKMRYDSSSVVQTDEKKNK